MSRPAPSWNDLALFVAVARAGTLAGASVQTGVSTATLSRRMTALEAQMARRLFGHGQAGYALTGDGRALLERCARMETAAHEIGAWQAEGSGPARVRLSAGTWTATALARDVARYWAPSDPWVPEFVHCDLDLDIARREIDIGIRNRRPEQAWLAGRRTATVRYAAYGHADAEGWIGISEDAVLTPSGRWVRREHGGAVVTTVNDPRLALTLAQAGVGRVVLPLFVGAISDLPRQGPVIDALTHDEWIVAHHEARHTPHIRAAMDALTGYLTARAAS